MTVAAYGDSVISYQNHRGSQDRRLDDVMNTEKVETVVSFGNSSLSTNRVYDQLLEILRKQPGVARSGALNIPVMLFMNGPIIAAIRDGSIVLTVPITNVRPRSVTG